MTRTSLPVAILAGGYATRLGDLTLTTPKALLDINGEPFIAHQLRLLAHAGVDKAVICASHLGQQIEGFVGDGHHLGVHVEFAYDGPRLLGTAGALRNARHLLGHAFFVLYGDSFLMCDYASVQLAFESSGRLGLMTVYRNDDRFDRSNVEFDGRSILAYDKRAPASRMRHIDYGLGVLAETALELVPEDAAYDLAELYGRLLALGELAAVEMHERFYEIGSLAGLQETRDYLAARERGAA
jgi:NDP-sugar pyrophosphorylase family protein